MADDVVARVPPALLDEGPEIDVHLAASTLDRLAGCLAWAAELRKYP
jgi:hypothetical protein